MIKQAADFAATYFGFTAPYLVIHMRFYWRKHKLRLYTIHDSSSQHNVTSILSILFLFRDGLSP